MMIGTAGSREVRDPLTCKVLGSCFSVYRDLGWGFLESVCHRAQLYNYRNATTIETGLLFNFGPRPAFERLILTNDRKVPKPLQL